MTPSIVAIFLLLGATVGFLAGLLGIGGGFITVPVLVEVLEHVGVGDAQLLPLAIGTSAASIAFSASASAISHHKHRAVLWSIVRLMAPGLILGSMIGPQVASALPMRAMAMIFGMFTWLTGFRMLSARPSPGIRDLPGPVGLVGFGALIGGASAMVGVGGAFLAVPFMTTCNVKVHEAVATSAAIGAPIAVVSTVGYVFAGWHANGLPLYSLGYVYLPGLVSIVVMSTILAPLGARLAHLWPVQRLRRVFSLLLLALGGWMWWKAFGT